MPPKIFIVEDAGEYRELLGHHLTSHWPDADIKTYDPTSSGRLPADFAGAGSDLVIIGSPAGGEPAAKWLSRFNASRRFPPVLVIGSGGERDIVEALKAGAAEYLSRARLNHARLISLVETALADSPSGIGLDAAGVPSLRGYDIREELAVSDISSVYLADEPEHARPVVLKVLRQTPDSGGEIAFERFLREYELIARINHPSIVKIFDLGVADDHAYIAMEYCGSGSLKRRILSGMQPDLAYQYMRQMAGALGALHAVDITHRDLKPTNVMFRDDGSLVLIDFGLAKQVRVEAEITGTGEIFGTPYYMSPEQGHGAATDERADIYSLGVIFYEMLTGQKPFEAETPMAMIIRHANAPVPRLADELSRYQPAVDRMMAKSPDERFQNTDDILAWAPAGDETTAQAQA